VEAIFFAALERTSAGERAAFLDQACAGDEDLRRRVDRLLAVQSHVGGFLELPVVPPADETGLGWVEGSPALDAEARACWAKGGYEILDELGRGGMGVVYRARQVGLERSCAVKMILSGSFAGPREAARFRTEAESIARLQHPNIVQIFEIGEHQGKPFFSLELCPGGSLKSQLDGTPWPANKAAGSNYGSGGGIYNAGTLAVTHSTFDTNNASPSLYNPVGNGLGGGIYNTGTMTLTDSLLASNLADTASSPGSAGGIYNAGTLTLDGCTLRANLASGGRYHTGGYGGGILNRGTLTVRGSLLSDNDCGRVPSALGGGILNLGQATVTDSTLTANAAGEGAPSTTAAVR
jgi:hypothetical protein